MFDEFLRSAFILTIVFSALPLCAGSLVGLIVSILQAATQIQEQSFLFVIKLATICAVLALGANWYGSQMSIFFYNILDSLVELGRGG